MGYKKFLGKAVDIFTGFSCERFLGISSDSQERFLGIYPARSQLCGTVFMVHYLLPVDLLGSVHSEENPSSLLQAAHFYADGLPNVGVWFTSKAVGERLCEILKSVHELVPRSGRGCKHGEKLNCK